MAGVALDAGVASARAELRARHSSFRLPHAFSLATALAAAAELLTLDQRLRRIADRERFSG